MSGVARSIPDIRAECGLCGAERDLMLGPWYDGERFVTITRCRDWAACHKRTERPTRAQAEGDETWI